MHEFNLQIKMSIITIASSFPFYSPSSKLPHIVLPKAHHISFNSAQNHPSISTKRSSVRLRQKIAVTEVKRFSSSSENPSNDNDDDDDDDDEGKFMENYSEDNEDDFHKFVSNLLPFFYRPFPGKQNVVELLNYLKTNLGDNIEFVMKPTLQHGINVGFTWRLQWSKTMFPLGKGFSFYIHQIYQGKFLIRNVEMLVNLPFHMEPIKLRFMALVMGIMAKMYGVDYKLSRYEIKRAMLALLLIVILLLCLSPEVY